MELSARNQLTRNVTGVKLGGVMTEISAEIARDQTLVSVITRGSAERLTLQAGDQVAVIIKSTEVIFGKDRWLPTCTRLAPDGRRGAQCRSSGRVARRHATHADTL